MLGFSDRREESYFISCISTFFGAVVTKNQQSNSAGHFHMFCQKAPFENMSIKTWENLFIIIVVIIIIINIHHLSKLNNGSQFHCFPLNIILHMKRFMLFWAPASLHKISKSPADLSFCCRFLSLLIHVSFLFIQDIMLNLRFCWCFISKSCISEEPLSEKQQLKTFRPVY